MDRRALTVFTAVASLGSVSAAAKHLHLTQPAVSKQVGRLEADLGLLVFHRTSSGMVPTAAGLSLLSMASDVLARFDQVEAVLESRFRGRPSFRVACPHATTESVLAPFLAEIDVPIVDLEIVPAAEVDDLLGGRADLAVSSLVPPAHRRQIAIATVPIMIQARDVRTRFPGAEYGDLESMTHESLVVPRSGVGAAVMSAVAHLAFLMPVRDVAAGSVAQAFAANGQGYALTTEPLRFGLDAIPARANGVPLTITLYASWDATHYATDALEDVAADLRSWLQAHPTWPDSAEV